MQVIVNSKAIMAESTVRMNDTPDLTDKYKEYERGIDLSLLLLSSESNQPIPGARLLKERGVEIILGSIKIVCIHFGIIHSNAISCQTTIVRNSNVSILC